MKKVIFLVLLSNVFFGINLVVAAPPYDDPWWCDHLDELPRDEKGPQNCKEVVVTVKAAYSPANVVSGGSTNLTWSSVNADTCWVDGVQSQTSGSIRSVANQTKSSSVICSSFEGAKVTKVATVTVASIEPDPVFSKQVESFSLIVQGRYYWELVFSYDNTSNTGDILHDIRIEKKKTVNATEFFSNTVNDKSIYTFNGKLNSSLDFIGLASSSIDLEYTIHEETSKDIVYSYRENTVIEETETTDISFTIRGGSYLELYRLVYVSNGVIVKTNILSTQPKPQNHIELEFTQHKHILGVPELAETLMQIRPRSDNIEEWDRIRDALVNSSHKTDKEIFSIMVNVFRQIFPRRDNIEEWADIRYTANEIMMEWDRYEKQELFTKLLNRLATIYPRSDNMEEWAEIRWKSQELLHNIVLR